MVSLPLTSHGILGSFISLLQILGFSMCKTRIIIALTSQGVERLNKMMWIKHVVKSLACSKTIKAAVIIVTVLAAQHKAPTSKASFVQFTHGAGKRL